MKITNQHSDDAVLSELGARLARVRVDRNLTQAHLAREAGISKRTVERLESGQSVQASSLVRVLRALELLPALNTLLPETGPGPMDLLRRRGRERKRASPARGSTDAPASWQWRDEE